MGQSISSCCKYLRLRSETVIRFGNDDGYGDFSADESRQPKVEAANSLGVDSYRPLCGPDVVQEQLESPPRIVLQDPREPGSKKAFHVVAVGPNPGAYATYNDYKDGVLGYPGAQYRGKFRNLEAAQRWFDDPNRE